MNNDNVTEILEDMIDKHGLCHVLTGLELVCAEKADHIRHNWQDAQTSKAWDRDAKACRIAAEKVFN